MIFDKAKIIAGIKNGLTANQKKQTQKIEGAIDLALNDMSLRMKDDGTLKKDSETLSVDQQEVTLKGSNLDLMNIYGVVITDSDGAVSVLDWHDRDKYLRDVATDTNRTAGLPISFTQLEAEEGYPILTFDRAMSKAGTLDVYYVPEVTSSTAHKLRAGAPLVNFSLAYFFGPDSLGGRGYYAIGKELIQKAKGKSRFVQDDTKSQFVMSKDDKEIRQIINDIRVRR